MTDSLCRKRKLADSCIPCEEQPFLREEMEIANASLLVLIIYQQNLFKAGVDHD